MAEVVINDKVKTHEEGNHTYIGKYKGKDFKVSMVDVNDDRELVYTEGKDNFTDEDKDVIFEQLDDMSYVDTLEEAGDDKVYVEDNYETWFAFKFEAYGSYGEHKFIVEEYSDDNGGDATFLEGEENFNDEEKELIYEAVNEYM